MTALGPVAFFMILMLGLVSLQNACSTYGRLNAEPQPMAETVTQTQVLAPQGAMTIETLIPLLLDSRIVFVGESHNRYDHHLNQLAIIRGLHEADPAMAIGLEMFQQPYQAHLDAFVNGQSDQRELLHHTEYFTRWGYDYRLYRPILEYARQHGIALIALNVPRELTRRVSQVGIDGLGARERTWAPTDIDRSDSAYRARLEQVYDDHGGQAASADFERFLDAQLLWDEGMADRAARYLRENPGKRLVVLAGSGHLAYGSGIPQRVQRRIPVASAIVLQAEEGTPESQGADYLILSQEISLPSAGRLGVMLETESAGMRVRDVVPESGAQRAGLRTDDRIVAIDDQPVQSMDDIRLALLDKDPGDSVQVSVVRANPEGMNRELALDVFLQP